MLSREHIEIDAVQKKVVDVLHLLLCLLGSLSVIVGVFRAHAIGNLRPVVMPVGLIVLAFLMFVVRRRVSWFVRSCVLLIGMMAVGFTALWNYGIAAPAGILVPTVVVIAWLIWNRNHALLFTVLGVAGTMVVAYKNISSGTAIDANMAGFNRTPIFWINICVLYTSIGAMILGVTRVLFGAFRGAWARAQEGERASKADKDRLAGILQGVNDAIFLQEPQTGRIVDVFGRYEEMYGCSREQILSMDVGRLSAGIPPWTTDDARQWFLHTLENGPQIFPWRAKHADGRLFWVEVAMRVVVVEGLERMLVTVRDIDASMHTQLELASLNADLERRVLLRTAEIQREREASDAFSYTVSHDLRAPLRAIDGYARILTEDFAGMLPDEARNYLGRMVAGADRMGRLIDALLSLSRLERQKIALETVDVAKVLDEVHQELRDAGNCRICERGFCDMAWSIGPLPEIHADPQLVKQVFANLLGNACKFTRETSDPRILVRAVERPDGTWFEIADNGSGFDMAYSDKLFKVFQRLHPDSIEGIGIGLATVKKIVDRLGGAIEAEGKPGEGATFRFRLEPSRTESVNRS